MALPWIIGGVAIVAGKMIYDAVTDDSSSSYSDRDDRDDREREVKERAKKERRKNLISEINSYKEEQLFFIKNKYNITIGFISDIENLNQNIYGNPYKIKIVNKPNNMKNIINSLKIELNELEEVLKELEVIENEALRKDR